MRIAVVGMGYVGSVTAACLADSGNSVMGVESDSEKLTDFQQGRAPLYEPGLEELLRRNLQVGRLRFSSDLVEATRASEIIFICVGTPLSSSRDADVSQVLAIAEQIPEAINEFKIIVLKSTVPVGTGDRVHEIISRRTQREFEVVANPEFLREGSSVKDFLHPERIILGTNSAKAIEIMKELYAPFVRTGKPIIVMDRRSAEVTKYAANLMLATRISLMNELASLCERVGADIDQVRRGVGTDSRIGSTFLMAGIGYGGSCLPKDIQALINFGHQHQSLLRIAEAVHAVNQEQPVRFCEKIHKHFQGQLSGRNLTVWGLAFKPGTEDMREAPSITIIERLLAWGARITAYDPRAQQNARVLFGKRISYAADLYHSLRGAEALLLVTEWDDFRNANFARIKQWMKSPVIFDGRNVYDQNDLLRLGFIYYGVGRCANSAIDAGAEGISDV